MRQFTVWHIASGMRAPARNGAEGEKEVARASIKFMPKIVGGRKKKIITKTHVKDFIRACMFAKSLPFARVASRTHAISRMHIRGYK